MGWFFLPITKGLMLRSARLLPSVDFGTVFACISFAHDNSASKTGFSCSSRFLYRSSGVSPANVCSQLDHGVSHTLAVEALQVVGDTPQRDGDFPSVQFCEGDNVQ